MNRHLSSEQISESLIGELSPDCQRHLKVCPDCRDEVARLQSALLSFKGSVHQWSAEQLPHRAPVLEWVRTGIRGWMNVSQIGWVTGVLVIGLAVSLVMPSNRATQHRPEVAAVDAALLSQVDADLSQPVPRPMEPLMHLVSLYDASAADGGPGDVAHKAKQARSSPE